MPVASVFISYRQENATHSKRVREFALKLRAEGIEVIHDGLSQEDLFHGNQPPNGWGLWSIQQASTAPTVIIVGSAGWFRVINSPEPTSDGKGAAAEATCVFSRLYAGTAANDFAAILFFDYANDLATLPPYLDTKCGRFDANKPDDFTRLLTWLRRPISAAPPASAVPVPVPSPVIAGPDFPDPPVLPDHDGFVDCRNAFAAFAQLLDRSARHRVLLVEGEGEHGKSSLVLRFFRHVQLALPPASTAFISLPERTATPDDYLAELADAFGIHTLAGDHCYGKTRSLLDARAGLPTVIFVDGFDHAQPAHADWLDLFLKRTIVQPLLRLVIAGRRVPSDAAQPWTICTEHIHCDPLAEPDAFVEHAAACGSTMPPAEIKACCSMLRSQRDSRKRRGMATDGLSPLALISEIEARRSGGASV